MAKKAKNVSFKPLIISFVILLSIITLLNLVKNAQKISNTGAAVHECTYLKEWGEGGGAEGQIDYPVDVAVQTKGYNVFTISQDNNKVVKTNSEGLFLLEWGSLGTGDGQFDHPKGIAIDHPISADSVGTVYVVDQFNHRVQVFNENGNFIKKWGSEGSGKGQFNRPSDIAIDIEGNIFVADTMNHRVQKFNKNGKYKSEWGSFGTANGQFNTPASVETDYSGNVYVVDYMNHRVQKFDNDGNYLSTWGGNQGSGDGEFSLPSRVAITRKYICKPLCSSSELCVQGSCQAYGYYEDVYITDMGNKRLKKYSVDGELLALYSISGSLPGQLSGVLGVAADVSDNVYVADASRTKILKFSCPTKIPPSPTPATYPIQLEGSVIPKNESGVYGVRNEWNPPTNDTTSSLYIWNGECKQLGDYGPGDLLWSIATTTKTSYDYVTVGLKEGQSYCSQIWSDVLSSPYASSNESTITISTNKGDCICRGAKVKTNNCIAQYSPLCTDNNICECN